MKDLFILITFLGLITGNCYSQKSNLDVTGEWVGQLHHPGDVFTKVWDVEAKFHQTGNQVTGSVKCPRGEVFVESLLDGEILADVFRMTVWNVIAEYKPAHLSGYNWCMGRHGTLKVIEKGQLYAVLKSYNCQDCQLILARKGKAISDLTAADFKKKYQESPKRGRTVAEVTQEMRRMEDELYADRKWNDEFLEELARRENLFQQNSQIRLSPEKTNVVAHRNDERTKKSQPNETPTLTESIQQTDKNE